MPTSSTSPSSGPDLYSIAGSIEPTRLSQTYRLGLLVVAVTMLLLPLFYISLIGVVGYGTWWHVTSNATLLAGSGIQGRLFAYLTPIIVGVVVMFFMIKPLLARPAKQAEPVQIDEDAQPMLFAFVRQICGLIGAPMPSRVLVDCRVNASAGLVRGVFSRDLALTIGLPLATGLSVRELGGVLAHEFGHFAQGGGMRLTALVRGVNAWFARVVYERDRWDEALERWSKQGDGRLMIILAVARGAVWLSRKVLAGLMWTGHAVSCFMMRQMEYDADSYEVKLAGVDAFVRTSTRLRELGMASQFAYAALGDGVQSGSIPGDMPAYVATQLARMPAEIVERIRAAPDDKTGKFDTHPSDADRLDAARAVGGYGVLSGGDAAASALFSDFTSLCATATRHHYEHDLGLEPTSLTFVSTEAAVSNHGERRARRQALDTLFAGCVSLLRPLHLPKPLELPLHDLIAASHSTRASMTSLGGEAMRAQYRQLEAFESQRIDAITAMKLHDASFKTVDAQAFGLQKGTREEAVSAAALLHRQQQALDASFQPFEAAAVSRLTHGVALAIASRATSGTVTRSPGPDPHSTTDADDLPSVLTALNAMANVVPMLIELRQLLHVLAIVEGNAEEAPSVVQAKGCVRQIREVITNRLGRLHDSLVLTKGPGGASTTEPTLAALCGLSASTSPDQGGAVVQRAWALYFDLLGRLTAATLQAEEDLGPTATRT